MRPHPPCHWIATWIETGQSVVLDLLLAEPWQDLVTPWLETQRSLLQLRRPGLLAPQTWGALDEFLYIATPFVEGTVLRRLAARGPLDPGHAIALSLEVARHANALPRDQAGSFGWIAMDNVVVQPTGAISVGPLLSWARFMSTLPTSKVGNAAYAPMAPEVIEGQPLSPTSDVFALGLLLLQLLGGSPHEGCKGLIEVLERNRAGFGEQLAASGLLPALRDVLIRALEVDPNHRIADLRRFADELRSAALDLDLELSTQALGKLVESS